jgi:hypothetical protein
MSFWDLNWFKTGNLAIINWHFITISGLWDEIKIQKTLAKKHVLAYTWKHI